ncbi:zinc ribbon domain-containing protein [Streptomyces sp. NPDC059378]|uniref:zinc ribbon domain-containing protein n=1 Tax=Streptomyces sp. NPDC059378 TaxID=3346815 RepID=UPI0036A41F7A
MPDALVGTAVAVALCARYVWSLAVEQQAHWRPGRGLAPGLAEQCRQLAEARRGNPWLAAGNADVQQQALKDFAAAKNARFTSGFGEPTWRRKHTHEGFRVIGTDRVPAFGADGSPTLNAKTGRQVMGRSVSGLNRAVLAQGWGLLRQRTGHKAPDRVEDVSAPHTSLRCSSCGWIDKNSRKSQAEFVCSSCGFACNADHNAAVNVAAGQGGIPHPRRSAGAGGATTATSRPSAREPQPSRVGIPFF